MQSGTKRCKYVKKTMQISKKRCWFPKKRCWFPKNDANPQIDEQPRFLDARISVGMLSDGIIEKFLPKQGIESARRTIF